MILLPEGQRRSGSVTLRRSSMASNFASLIYESSMNKFEMFDYDFIMNVRIMVQDSYLQVRKLYFFFK